MARRPGGHRARDRNAPGWRGLPSDRQASEDADLANDGTCTVGSRNVRRASAFATSACAFSSGHGRTVSAAPRMRLKCESQRPSSALPICKPAGRSRFASSKLLSTHVAARLRFSGSRRAKPAQPSARKDSVTMRKPAGVPSQRPLSSSLTKAGGRPSAAQSPATRDCPAASLRLVEAASGAGTGGAAPRQLAATSRDSKAHVTHDLMMGAAPSASCPRLQDGSSEARHLL